MGMSLAKMRLGLYGGTFDPVHKGHLAVARAAREAFGLDRVLVIPNRLPPHKQALTGASYEQRLEMVKLACAGDEGLEACDVENREGKSYTIQTLERLRESHGSGVDFFFIIGADAFAEVLTWYRVAEVFAMTEFIVAARPGFDYEVPAGARVHRLDSLDLPESSSGIRTRLAQGLGAEDLPEAVADYIRREGLYRKERVTAV
jgi:nicotinate-nucleotide adenylyltransferase